MVDVGFTTLSHWYAIDMWEHGEARKLPETKTIRGMILQGTAHRPGWRWICPLGIPRSAEVCAEACHCQGALWLYVPCQTLSVTSASILTWANVAINQLISITINYIISIINYKWTNIYIYIISNVALCNYQTLCNASFLLRQSRDSLTFCFPTVFHRRKPVWRLTQDEHQIGLLPAAVDQHSHQNYQNCPWFGSSYPSASCVMSSASAEGVALAPAFVGPVVRAPAPVARPQQGTRPSQDSAGAASTLQMFMLGTAGAAACRRAARGVSTAARKAVPRAKMGQRLQGRSVTSPLGASLVGLKAYEDAIGPYG